MLYETWQIFSNTDQTTNLAYSGTIAQSKRLSRGERRDVVLDELLELSVQLVSHLALLDLGEDLLLRGLQVLDDCRKPTGQTTHLVLRGRPLLTRLLPCADLVNGDLVEQTVNTSVHDRNLCNMKSASKIPERA